MTGDRGMEQLLNGTVRTTAVELDSGERVLQGTGGFSALSTDVQSVMSTNAVLSPSVGEPAGRRAAAHPE